MFSDLTFTVAAAPDQVKLHSSSDTLAIPEDLINKGIFSAKSSQMNLSENTTISHTYTATLVIHKSQVDMLAKKVCTIVN